MQLAHCLCVLILLCSAAAIHQYKDQACAVAERCNAVECDALGPENCHCSGNETIINLADRPQIVYLTFDDAFTDLAETQFYRSLFNGTYKNPNGCDIRATHFLTQSYTDYSLVNHYWHMGHEMASHSITHRNDVKYWQNLTPEQWKDEMVGMRKMIGQFASIDPCEIRGMRAPFLQGGGDNMFRMLKDNNFTYDCSWPTRSFGYTDAMNGLYPYTLDYQTAQDCPIKPCPKCSYPGMWVQPMIDLEDEWIGSNPQCPTCGNVCSMLDGCVIMGEQTKEHVYSMLMKNFNRTYNGDTDEFGQFMPGNKAPWGLYMHAAWFFGEQAWHYDGYKMFLNEITNNAKYPDVFIVPIKDGLEYMKKPVPMQVLNAWGNDDSKSPFGCKSIEDQTGKYANFRCGGGQSCRFNVTEPDDGIFGERYMKICKYKSDQTRQNCPEETNYPWLGEKNHCGGNSPCADC
eukprot:GFUD01032448.1.p1 GENE.GFUD01032448.1~~GFUD01032448.1.p1  ORF type:complete len:465 (+),score=61.54 GFUD01032448.1:24-1397(+)